MKILSVNAGSSSLKFQMYEMPEEKVLISGVFERIGMDGFYTIKINGEKIKKEVELKDHSDAVKYLIEELFENKVITSLEEIKGVGHRVVHGGDKYASSTIITDDVINTIDDLSSLAPLHNPANLMGIRAFNEQLPNAISVAVFDTAFHQTMPEESYLYAIPYDWYTQYGVRRYGFHGISHDYLTETLKKELHNEYPNLITCHLGNGGSISAIKDGICYDTSLGFSPNAGLVMGTRSGDIDPALIPYVMDKANMSLDEVMNALSKKSGYLGVSGISSDSRDIEDGIKEGNERCILAQHLYVKRAIEYIAKYYVELEHVDAICFAGGIGENSISTRKAILEGLKCLGISLDEQANDVRGEFRVITSKDSSIPCYIIPTDEEVMIARDTYQFIEG